MTSFEDVPLSKLFHLGAQDETRLGADADVKVELYAALKEVLDIAKKLEDADGNVRKSNSTKSKMSN
jgi:hypothetical protein